MLRPTHLLASLAVLAAGIPSTPGLATPPSVPLPRIQEPASGLVLPVPGLGPHAFPVRAWSWSVGQATFKVPEGRLTPILSGSRTVGFRLEGPGTLAYRSEDPLERSTFLYNLRHSTSLKPIEDQGGLAVSVPFREASVWLEGVAPPRLEGTGTLASTPEAWAAQRVPFESLSGLDRGQQALLAADSPTPGPWVWAEVSADQSLLYRLDGRIALEESLALAYAPDEFTPNLLQRIGRLPQALSRQPLGRTLRSPLEPNVYLTHVDLDLEAYKDDRLVMKVVETLVPTVGGTRLVSLNLSSGTPDPKDPDRWRGLRVKSVRGSDGTLIPHHHARGTLLLAFPAPLPAKQPVKVTFELEGNILVRFAGNDYWELGTYAWFPQPELGGQYYKVDARLAVEKPFLPVASGPTLSRTSDERFNRQTVRIDKPIQFFVVLGGKYRTFEDTRDGLTVRVHGYAFRPVEGERLARLSRSIIKFYEGFLGRFPFDQFDIVEKNEYGYGQAPPGLMIITREALNPQQDILTNAFARGVNARFAHEIAHQYWGHVLKMPSAEEQWLTESFADYSSALFMEHAKGKDGIERMRGEWRRHSGEAGSAATIPTANRLVNTRVPSEPGRIRTGLLYSRGPLVLDRIRKEVGDNAFYAFLGSLQLNFPFRFSSTQDVQGVLGAVTKKDWGPYFDTHVWGATPP